MSCSRPIWRLRLGQGGPRYEVHHGVKILDDALVEAAVVSDRYIADRFLPDKARRLRISNHPAQRYLPPDGTPAVADVLDVRP